MPVHTSYSPVMVSGKDSCQVHIFTLHCRHHLTENDDSMPSGRRERVIVRHNVLVFPYCLTLRAVCYSVDTVIPFPDPRGLQWRPPLLLCPQSGTYSCLIVPAAP